MTTRDTRSIGTAQAAREARERLTEHVTHLTTKHKEARHRRQLAIASLEPTDAIVKNAREYVDRRGAERAQEIAHTFADAFSHHLNESASGFVLVAPQAPEYAWNKSSPLTFDDLCVLIPDAVKAAIESVIRLRPDDSFGPIQKRQALISQIDREIADIEVEHTELCDEAAAGPHPMTIPLLEPVATRRHMERRAEQQRALDAEQRARDDAAGVRRQVFTTR